MLRDEQPLTDELAKAVVERFKLFLQRVNKSAESAAKSMGVSASTISQVLSGTYAADAEKHLRTMDKWLENQIQREAAAKPSGFVKIGLAEQIYGIASWVMKNNGVAIIHGPSGCGKSMTMRAFQADTPGSIYLSIDSAGRSARAVLEGLAHALRMGGLKLNGAQLFRQIAGVMKDTGRTIIIDEVHKLAGRANDDALHVLRDLHDQTGCPMLWVGNGKIANYLREGHTDGYDPLDQIFGRVSVWLDLTEKAKGGDDDGRRLYSVEDIRRVFSASKIRLASDAEKFLLDMTNDPSKGCLRAAKFLVGMAVVVANGAPITAEMLRSIQRQRLGSRAAEAAERESAQLSLAINAA